MKHKSWEINSDDSIILLNDLKTLQFVAFFGLQIEQCASFLDISFGYVLNSLK